MDKPHSRFLQNFLIVLLVSILIWSIWPLPVATQSLHMNTDYLNQKAILECKALRQLESFDFIIRSPQRIWKGEPANLWLILNRKEASQTNVTACTISLETQLDLPGVTVHPGARLITPFGSKEEQLILYAITANQEGKTQGTLWIRAVYYAEAESSIETITLFSVPVSLEIKSIFGMPPIFVRYLCLLGLLLVLAIWLQSKLQWQE